MTTPLEGVNQRRSRRAPSGITRVLPPWAEDLRQHLSRVGPVPYRGRPGALIADVAAAGLTGRGGAAFPAHRKLEIVASAGGAKVVVGSTETTAVKGNRMPPTPRPGQTWVEVDATKHKG